MLVCLCLDQAIAAELTDPNVRPSTVSEISAGAADVRHLFPNSAEFPVIRADGRAVNVDSVCAVRFKTGEALAWSVAKASTHDPRAMTRYTRIATNEELVTLLRADARPAARSHLFSTTQEGFFNLWKVDELHAGRDANVAVLAFDVESAALTQAAVGVGCDYAFALFLDGQPLYSRLGYSGFRDSSALVELPLRPGKNRVTVIFEAGENKVRRSYYQRAWTAKIRFFSKLEDARLEHVAAHNHPLDTPIVSEPDALRCQVGAPFFREATAYSFRGEALTTGTVQPDGRILWEDARKLSTFFHLSIDNGAMTEPVIISRQEDLEQLPIPKLDHPEAAAWFFRTRHLLSEEYRSHRSGIAWLHKFANACAGAIAPQIMDEHPEIWSPAPRLGTFLSDWDGTRQHYLYYFPRDHETGVRVSITADTPVIVITPTVHDPVRPLLESGILAGHSEYENWCAVADRVGCILVWPGYNEVDFGGDLSARALSEAMRHFTQRFRIPSNPTFLLGVCSSGVMATRYAAAAPDQISGVILYSPYLLRSGLAHVANVPATQENTPSTYLDADNHLGNLAAQLKQVPCTILFDSAMEGHGSRGQTTKFVEGCIQAGTPVEEIPCEPSSEWIWGERMKHRLSELFARALPRAGSGRPSWNSAPPLEGDILKSMLLSGFHVDADDAALAEWIDRWESGYKVWRSAPLPRGPHAGSRVTVRTQTISPDEVGELLSRLNYTQVALEESAYFGICADPNNPNQVLVFRSDQARAPYPQFDPVLDGVVRSAIWKQENGAWKPLPHG